MWRIESEDALFPSSTENSIDFETDVGSPAK